MTFIDDLKRRAGALRVEVVALSIAARDPRTPFLAKAIAAGVAAYALSPIDLIPDFVPILGYLDDLVILPAGIAVAIRLIPDEVMVESRFKASEIDKPTSSIAAAAIVVIWLLFVGFSLLWLIRLFSARV